MPLVKSPCLVTYASGAQRNRLAPNVVKCFLTTQMSKTFPRTRCTARNVQEPEETTRLQGTLRSRDHWMVIGGILCQVNKHVMADVCPALANQILSYERGVGTLECPIDIPALNPGNGALAFDFREMDEFLRKVHGTIYLDMKLSRSQFETLCSRFVLQEEKSDASMVEVFAEFLPMVWRNETLQKILLERPLNTVVRVCMRYAETHNGAKDQLMFEILQKLLKCRGTGESRIKFDVMPLLPLCSILRLENVHATEESMRSFLESFKYWNAQGSCDGMPVAELVQMAGQVSELDDQIEQKRKEVEELRRLRDQALSELEQKTKKLKAIASK